MEQQHPFDRFARTLAQTRSRRSLLRAIGGGLAAATAGTLLPRVGRALQPCPAGQIDCGSQCADLLTDPANCGACGAVVPLGGSCTNGVPSAPVSLPFPSSGGGGAGGVPGCRSAADCAPNQVCNTGTGYCQNAIGPLAVAVGSSQANSTAVTPQTIGSGLLLTDDEVSALSRACTPSVSAACATTAANLLVPQALAACAVACDGSDDAACEACAEAQASVGINAFALCLSRGCPGSLPAGSSSTMPANSSLVPPSFTTARATAADTRFARPLAAAVGVGGATTVQRADATTCDLSKLDGCLKGVTIASGLVGTYLSIKKLVSLLKAVASLSPEGVAAGLLGLRAAALTCYTNFACGGTSCLQCIGNVCIDQCAPQGTCVNPFLSSAEGGVGGGVCCPNNGSHCNDICACPAGSTCLPLHSALGVCCDNAQVCGDACCSSGETCVRGGLFNPTDVCCPQTRLCANGSVCCNTSQFCDPTTNTCKAICSASNPCTGGCCDGNGACQEGLSTLSCGPIRGACQVCAANYICDSGSRTCVCPPERICGTSCCPGIRCCTNGACGCPSGQICDFTGALGGGCICINTQKPPVNGLCGCPACPPDTICATTGQYAGQCVCTNTGAPPLNSTCGCPAGRAVCGTTCCPLGAICATNGPHTGQCICANGGQPPVNGVCSCPSGQVACGSTCCYDDPAYTCSADGQCVCTGATCGLPNGNHFCCASGQSCCGSGTANATCCAAGQVCAGGPGAIGSVCCPANQVCGDSTTPGHVCCQAGGTCNIVRQTAICCPPGTTLCVGPHSVVCCPNDSRCALPNPNDTLASAACCGPGSTVCGWDGDFGNGLCCGPGQSCSIGPSGTGVGGCCAAGFTPCWDPNGPGCCPPGTSCTSVGCPAGFSHCCK